MFDLGLRHSTAMPRDIHAPRDACVVGLRVTSSFHWGYHACSSRIFNITSSPLFRTKSTHHATSTRQGTPAWIFGRSESISLLTRRTSCRKRRKETFLGSGGRNESDSHYLVRISVTKIFHEPDVHHFWKVRIKRFRSQENEMSLTAITSLESAR